MLFAPPALHQTAQPLDALLEALEALPEAITDGRPARVPDAARKAALEWSRNKAQLLLRTPEADRPRLESAMEGTRAADAHAAAESALDASDLLLQLAPAGRARELRRADQDGMRAWIRASAGRWEGVPDLDASFAWLVAHDEGRHATAVPEVKAALHAFDDARRSRSKDPALRAAQRLLDLVDELER